MVNNDRIKKCDPKYFKRKNSFLFFNELKFLEKIMFKFFARRLIYRIINDHYHNKKEAKKLFKSILNEREKYIDWQNIIYMSISREVHKTYNGSC